MPWIIWRFILRLRRVADEGGDTFSLASLLAGQTVWLNEEVFLKEILNQFFCERGQGHRPVLTVFLLDVQEYVLRRLCLARTSGKVLMHPRAAAIAVAAERELHLRGWIRIVSDESIRLELTKSGAKRLRMPPLNLVF